MIIDCFIFFNELDLLEIRLNELKGVVDVFVLTEATLTHRGNEKPLYFKDNKERFAEFNIKHVVVDNYDGIDLANPWEIEDHQRRCGIDHIKKMNPLSSDVILFSDCDEIWRAEAVRVYATTSGWQRVGAFMWLFYYYMNCLHVNSAWFPARWVKGDSLDIVDAEGSKPLRGCVVNKSFTDTGWHFSYLGDIKEKLSAFAHSEYDKPPYNTAKYIEERKSNLQSLFDDENKFVIIEDLDFLPRHVLENMDRFKGYISNDST